MSFVCELGLRVIHTRHFGTQCNIAIKNIAIKVIIEVLIPNQGKLRKEYNVP
jgi:hypothetical protein